MTNNTKPRPLDTTVKYPGATEHCDQTSWAHLSIELHKFIERGGFEDITKVKEFFEIHGEPHLITWEDGDANASNGWEWFASLSPEKRLLVQNPEELWNHSLVTRIVRIRGYLKSYGYLLECDDFDWLYYADCAVDVYILEEEELDIDNVYRELIEYIEEDVCPYEYEITIKDIINNTTYTNEHLLN